MNGGETRKSDKSRKIYEKITGDKAIKNRTEIERRRQKEKGLDITRQNEKKR